VWRNIDGLFRPGDRVLDLGCGTGDDALRLAQQRVAVLGIDASTMMVEAASNRGVTARRLAIEEIAALDGPFHGAISNFGALNCVADLPEVARHLAALLPAGAPFVLCVIGRFSIAETLRYLMKGDLKRATRRWSGRAEWRGIPVYYRSAREIRQALAPWFTLERRASIGRGDHQLYIFRRSAA
jgi:cyclopropane fatty-acyl-phospholipid synthase-like methyltransferase